MMEIQMSKIIRILFLLTIAVLSALPVSAIGNYASRPGFGGISVSFNGKFIRHPSIADGGFVSENGIYSCRFDIIAAGDEIRELANFRFYENDQLLYQLKKAPGSDLYISDSGITAFLDHTYHFRNELTVNIYSKSGQAIYSGKFAGAALFGFSPDGNKFGVGTTANLHIISLLEGKSDLLRKGFQFDISADSDLVAVAVENKILIYTGNRLAKEIQTDYFHTRGLEISPDNKFIAAVDKRHLKVFSLADGVLLFADTLSGPLSYRDLAANNGLILTGIHYRDNTSSRGILREYDYIGNIIMERTESRKAIPVRKRPQQPDDSFLTYDPIPWPFEPYDSVCTVWNYYEQHMAYNGSSYLHQGLDLITPIGEPVYAVCGGVVKCVLTLGGSSYWRIAISPEQSFGFSNGWLYAHLVQSSIQFDVGDTVAIYDYLGDIVQWYSDWGHIHFVEIRDYGLVWHYDDNEWGINYNPLLSLRPDTDTIPPVFDDVFENSKFAFCGNETSVYQNSDSLYGDIDIIAKIRDLVGDSEWEQPAFETYYWVVGVATGDTVFPRTLGQILNHAYNFYSVDPFIEWATVIYKRDNILIPSDWMNTRRDYYHIMTNNNGDSLIELSEKQLAFHTDNYTDGDYRIFIEARDEYGNSTIDSMDVRFKNGNVGVTGRNPGGPRDFYLARNYPNPFNAETMISYTLPNKGMVTLKIYDLMGREIASLVNGIQGPGDYSVLFDAGNHASGVYFSKLESEQHSQTRKLILIR